MTTSTVALLASGTSSTATTTVSFTAQPAGTLLVLQYGGDDYRTTTGTGRPESTGWTLISDQKTFLGHAAWYKIATGSETSVQYTIGSASPSAYQLFTATNVAATAPLDVSNGAFAQSSSFTYTTPTVTTTAGDRVAFAMIGGSSTTAFTALTSWVNSYTDLGSAFQSTATTRDVIGASYLNLVGGGPTSSGATYSTSAQSRTGIIAVFKLASAGGSNLTVTPADNVGVTDSASEVQSFVRSATETVAVTDSVTAQRTGTQTQTLTEPVGVTDALAVGWGRAATISDGVGVTDPGQSLDMGAALTDPMGVTDAATEVQAYAATLTDMVGVTDAATASRSGAGSASPNDVVAVTDAVTAAWSRVTTVADFLNLTDTASSSTASDGAANVNDPAGVTDAVGWTTGRNRPLTDPVGVTDGVVAVLDRAVTIADTLGLADQPTPTFVGDPSGFVDVRVLAVADRSRTVTTSDRSRTVTVTEHPRTVTITDRS